MSESAARCPRATPRLSRRPTTSTGTPTIPRRPCRWRTWRAIVDGRALLDTFASVARRKPLVVVKGGATEGGAKAAASHTGALAADDKVFDGACRQAGVTRAADVEEAFDAAATFATQPLPKGPNVVVLTTAGGWGVVTSDAIARADGLTLMHAARRPDGRDRHEAAGALEPQQPGRLRRRRDP